MKPHVRVSRPFRQAARQVMLCLKHNTTSASANKQRWSHNVEASVYMIAHNDNKEKIGILQSPLPAWNSLEAEGRNRRSSVDPRFL